MDPEAELEGFIAEYTDAVAGDRMNQALARTTIPLDPSRPGRLVIKSISVRQRPRRS